MRKSREALFRALVAAEAWFETTITAKETILGG